MLLLPACAFTSTEPGLPADTAAIECGASTTASHDTGSADAAARRAKVDDSTSSPDSADSSATDSSSSDPDDDFDGDGWTESQGDCDDRHAAAHPHLAESCETAADDDCDGSVNESCARVYVDHTGSSILFDDFGAMYSTHWFVYSNEAEERLCEVVRNAANDYSSPECPQCTWTYNLGTLGTRWSDECAATLGLDEGGTPPAEDPNRRPVGYASYYLTEGGEVWGPVLLRYYLGTWYPTYGVNQSGGTASLGPVTVVNFGERDLMYYSDAYASSGDLPYSYYSSPWP